ncbi:heme ABC transporter ATP-binding protein [Arcanobacterium haemolyticum]|nr:heme ABC transporter ATP-binding protein [Arcanobacterium haemolyticum]
MGGRVPAIEARNLVFGYGERRVIDDVSLEVYPGQIVGLLGPNGTGKSTLLGVLSGDLVAREGCVRIFGKPLEDYGRKELARLRAVMPQASEFPFAYMAHDIVNMGRSCWDTDDQENEAIIREAMDKTDVLGLADRDVTRLSGGEKARVTLARVLAQQAKIVFLDEPTAALDIAHQERTMELCVDEAEAGKAVVAVMHDIQLAAAYCDVIALMDGGRIVACGSPRDVLTSEMLTSVYSWPIDVSYTLSGDIVVLPGRVKRRAVDGV